MGLHYRVPLPGPFYYSGRVGPKHWLLRSSNTDAGPMGFSAVSAAAAGSEPRFEAVRFRSGSAAGLARPLW